MKKGIIMLILTTIELFSCRQVGRSKSDTVNVRNVDSTNSAQIQKPNDEHFHTKYTYTDAMGANLIIQNSFPKAGINYKAPDGKKYVYAVFWTRVVNETNKPVELTIDFPVDSFEIPSSSGNYMKLLLPSDTVTAGKVPLYDYGLLIKPFLDSGMYTSSSLKRTIYPEASGGFYVVTLSNRGVGGTLRTGFNLKGQALYYKMNDKEIRCGKINLKDLKRVNEVR